MGILGSLLGGEGVPLQNEGDILVHDGTQPVALPIGAAGEVLTSDGTTASWEPLPPVEIAVKEAGASVSTSIMTLDFGAGFDITESPSGEANITLDMAEASYDNSTSGLTATDVQAAIDELAASGGGGSGWSSRDHSLWDYGFSYSAASIGTWSNNSKTVVNAGGANAIQLVSALWFGGTGGKFYFEVIADTVNSNLGIGVATRAAVYSGLTTYVGASALSFGYWFSGSTFVGGVGTAGFNTYTDADVIGVAVDADSGKIWWSKNGTWEGSGDPAAGTNARYTSALLTQQLYIHTTPYATNSKATLHGLSSELSYSPPTGFVAAFD